MFISDYLVAFDILHEALESDFSVCFERIECSAFGDRVFFYPNRNSAERYSVNIKTKSVQYLYSDTWRNPDHRVIISAGNVDI